MLSLRKIQAFSVVGVIKHGSYSSVYRVSDKTNQCYAVKILNPEYLKVKKTMSIFGTKKVIKEGKILAKLQKIPGIPKLYFQGYNPDVETCVIVTELLGKDLTVLLSEKKIFSLDFISFLGVQMLTILEEIHKRQIVHRDLKPDNILLSSDNSNTIYLTDFGLSKIERKKKKVNKFKKPQFIGNMKFASLNSHLGLTITKKDDLESLGYIILNYIQGSLPWESENSPDIYNKIELIGIKKTEFLKEEKKLPFNLKEYFTYLQKLKPNDFIDYKFLRNLFENICQKSEISTKPSPLDMIKENRSFTITQEIQVDPTKSKNKEVEDIINSQEFDSINLSIKLKQIQILEK